MKGIQVKFYEERRGGGGGGYRYLASPDKEDETENYTPKVVLLQIGENVLDKKTKLNNFSKRDWNTQNIPTATLTAFS